MFAAAAHCKVVRHFLDEYEQYKQYRGVPCSGFMTQDMENPAQVSVDMMCGK